VDSNHRPAGYESAALTAELRRPAGAILAALLLALGLALAGSRAAASGTAQPLVKLSPRTGDVNTVFLFKGSGWQPRRRVDATYFVSSSAARPYRSFKFRARGKGGFVFQLTKPIGLVDAGVTSRMCFRQRNTRPKVPRVNRVCANFYVAAPAAQFMPSTGKPGDLFLLVVTGFLAGRRLEGTLTRPTGTTKTFVFKTRTQEAFVSGGPSGPIFVPRGGAAVRFPTVSTDAPGTYTVLVSDPRAGSRARAAVVLVQ
jgi:hypothetical protein